MSSLEEKIRAKLGSKESSGGDLEDLLSGTSSLDSVLLDGVTESFLISSVDEVYSRPQVRTVFDPEYISELAASMELNGQEQPIIVCPRDAEGYRIQKGECRWRAVKLAGIANIKMIVKEPEKTAALQTVGQLVENVQREDLTPMEIAVALEKLRDEHGMNGKQLAAHLGKKPGWVSKHLKLTELPDSILSLYHGGVRDIELLNALRQVVELSDDVDWVLEGVADGGITRKRVQEHVKLLKDQKLQSSEKALKDVPAEEPSNQKGYNLSEDEGRKSDLSSQEGTEKTEAEEESSSKPPVTVKPAKETKAEVQTTFIEPVSILVEVDGQEGKLVLNQVHDELGKLLVDIDGNVRPYDVGQIQLRGAELNGG